jgi:hypothetical protein
LPPVVANGKLIAISQSFATSVPHVLDGQTGAILQELPCPSASPTTAKAAASARASPLAKA